MKLLLFSYMLLMVFLLPENSFYHEQLKHLRVATAKAEKEEQLRQLCIEKGLKFPLQRIFIRAFKEESQLEVWGRNADQSQFTLLKTYAMCAGSGSLGPKRKEGDRQMPEGFYKIVHFNPQSNFYLSLGIDYPNASDKILSHKTKPGGAIYIHGNCVTIGCFPIGDEGIKEVYLLSVLAKNSGQNELPVHIFPARLTTTKLSAIETFAVANAELKSFWQNLKEGYDYFESKKRLPQVKVLHNGRYTFH